MRVSVWGEQACSGFASGVQLRNCSQWCAQRKHGRTAPRGRRETTAADIVQKPRQGSPGWSCS